jgi:ribosome-associated translation inhibitor RaiA
MKVEIRGKGLRVTNVLSAYIQRRLVFALGRLGGRVEKVLVWVEDTAGSMGGIDKQYRIAVVVPRSTTAMMEGRNSNLCVAINCAVAKASRYVADRLKQPHWTRKDRVSSQAIYVTHC